MRRESLLRLAFTLLALVALATTTASCERCGDASSGASGSPSASSASSASSTSIDAAVSDAATGAASTELPPDAPFEGTIVADATTMSDDGKELNALYTFTVKAHAVRWDVYGERADDPAKTETVAYRIFDGAHSRFYTVIPSEKVILVADAPTVEAAEFGTPKPYELTPIPGPGRVADYPCERMETKDTQHRYQTCVAKGLVPFPLHLLSGVVGKTLAFNPELLRKDLFPLSGIVYPLTKKDAGKGPSVPEGMFTVRKIERKRVADSLFVLPALPMKQVNRLQYGSKKAQ